jgi:small GTP-binding protein
MQSDQVQVKVILLGNSGVGKTSLITRLKTGQFPSKIDPTVGVNHQCHPVLIGHEQVTIFLWDTAGQEQFQALTPLYCHSSSTALIVCARNDISSIHAIPTWFNFLTTACENVPPVILIVNKNDRLAEAVMTEEEIREQFGGQFRSIFYTSALTGENVDTVFFEAAQAAFVFQGKTIDSMITNEDSSGCC